MGVLHELPDLQQTPSNLSRAPVRWCVGWNRLAAGQSSSGAILAKFWKLGSPAAAPAPAPTGQTQSPAGDAPEMSAQDVPGPLRVRVNLVPVRVVVRDPQGHAVASLHKEDFQLFQDGKPQEISNFAVETLDSLSQHVVQPQTVSTGGSRPPAFLPPSRFVAFLFDDPHLNLQDLMQARIAAGRYLDASLTPTDRVAILTVSGQNQMDFTDDRVKLHKALLQLLPRDITGTSHSDPLDCTPMDFNEADLIQSQNDAQAVAVATQDTLQCDAENDPTLASAIASGQVPPSAIARAQGQVAAQALRIEQQGTQQSLSVFRRIDEITARMSALPGQRSIVLISPGFIYPTLEMNFSQVVDHAIRSSVFINTLDARGLYTPNSAEISASTRTIPIPSLQVFAPAGPLPASPAKWTHSFISPRIPADIHSKTTTTWAKVCAKSLRRPRLTTILRLSRKISSSTAITTR